MTKESTAPKRVMRNLNNRDLPKVIRIMRKAGVKSKIFDLDLPKDENGEILLDDQEYFIVLLLEIIETVPDAEKEIFELLADIAGVKRKEMEEDEFEILLEVIEHLKGQDKLITFLQSAFKLVN